MLPRTERINGEADVIDTKEEIAEKLTSLLVEMFEISSKSIHAQARLYEDLDIDSIDAVDLIVRINEITGKKVVAEDFKSVRLVQDVIDVMYKLIHDIK